MNWECPRCHNELGELNGYCEYCKSNDNLIIYNPDKYYVREVCVYHICQEVSMSEQEQGLSGEELLASIEANTRMTPQEKLFAKLFYHETILVKDMELLELRAHREELAKIAFEARARHQAATAEEDKRKNKSDKPKGFERSVNVDEASTEAINKIKERQTRLSKKEQVQAQLAKLYMTAGADSSKVEQIMSAGKILEQVKDKKSIDIITGRETSSPLSQENGFVIQKSKEQIEQKDEPTKPIFNPFEKK